MTVWRDLRVEWMRLFRSKGTWLALLAASAAPLVGYGLYQPAGGGTTAALVLLNPMLAGALGGALAFAVLTLSEMNRVKKGRMGPLTDSVVSPLRMAVVRTVVLMLTAVVSSLVTSLLYLPYTWYRLGETFQGKEYVQVALLFLLPFLEMTVLAAAAFLPNIPAGGCLCAASPGTFAGGTGPLESGHLFAVLDGFVQPGFFRRLRQYDDFPAGAVQPFAVAVPLWRALGGVPSVRSKPRQGVFLAPWLAMGESSTCRCWRLVFW